MSRISFENNVLHIDSNSFSLDHNIEEAFAIEDRIIVLFDPDANMGNEGQFRNLLCLQADGKVRWVAELPTEKSTDVYYKVAKRNPLIVYSFCSYECEIDIATGRIRTKAFTK